MNQLMNFRPKSFLIFDSVTFAQAETILAPLLDGKKIELFLQEQGFLDAYGFPKEICVDREMFAIRDSLMLQQKSELEGLYMITITRKGMCSVFRRALRKYLIRQEDLSWESANFLV